MLHLALALLLFFDSSVVNLCGGHHDALADDDDVRKLEDVCRRRSRGLGKKDDGDEGMALLRRVFSGKRQFGAVLHVPWRRSIAVVLRRDEGFGDEKLLTGDLDCRFTLKPPRPGTNVTFVAKWWQMTSNCTNFLQIIYSSETLLIQLIGSGTYVFTSALYLPMHVRTSVCKETNATAGLVFIASSSDGGGDNNNNNNNDDGDAATSPILWMFSYVGPVVFLFLVVLLAALGCCVFLPSTCRRDYSTAARAMTARGDESVAPIPTADKPPTYDELFPDGRTTVVAWRSGGSERSNKRRAEVSPPPSYDHIRPETNNAVAARVT